MATSDAVRGKVIGGLKKETAPEGTSAAKSFGDARSRFLRHDRARHLCRAKPAPVLSEAAKQL